MLPGSVIAMSERVAVVGAGLMGAQIGAEYALGGYGVTLLTRSRGSAEAAVARAAHALRFLAQGGLADAQRVEMAIPRLTPATDVASACRGAVMVVESIPERLDAKVEVLRQAAAAAPGAILATNTSSLSVTELGRAVGAAERIIGTHYWNPPSLMPLVEVVPGAATVPGITERTVAVLTGLGKEPVVVADVPGFVWNRLQLALLREAVALAVGGVTSVETIDRIVRRGLGRRWSLLGPFETMALGGPQTFATVARQLFPHLACELDPDTLLTIPLPAGDALAAAARRRNAGLARWRVWDQEETDGQPQGH